MRLDLAARVLKRIAEEGRLSLLPQLPPSISSLLHEDAEVIAAALERLPAPIRSGMTATLIETGEREGLMNDPAPAVLSESLTETSEEEGEDRDEDEEWASAGVAYEPSHEPEMRFLPRSNVFSYGPLAGDFPLVSIVSTDVNEARLELSRALPYGSFVPLTTAPVEGTDPRSAVVTARETPSWPPVPASDRGVGVLIFERDAVVLRAQTDDEVFNAYAADLLAATCGDGAIFFFVPGCSRFTAILRKTHPSLVGFFAEIRREDASLLTIGHPGNEPIVVSGRAPNGRPMCRYTRPVTKGGVSNCTLEDLRRYVSRLLEAFPECRAFPEGVASARTLHGGLSARKVMPSDKWARDVLAQYGIAPFDRFASVHMPFNDPALIAAVDAAARVEAGRRTR